MQYEFALAYRQNITDYRTVKDAIKAAVSSAIGTSPTNVDVAASNQGVLCSVSIQKTSSTLPFRRLYLEFSSETNPSYYNLRGLKIFKDNHDSKLAGALFHLQGSSKSKKSTISFAIYSGVSGQRDFNNYF